MVLGYEAKEDGGHVGLVPAVQTNLLRWVRGNTGAGTGINMSDDEHNYSREGRTLCHTRRIAVCMYVYMYFIKTCLKSDLFLFKSHV